MAPTSSDVAVLRWPSDRPLRTVFMGTPEFAVPSLETVARDTSLVGVVSQPDRPRGRGLAPATSAVAARARALGVPLLQPETLRDPAARAALAAWDMDLVVVVAYGKILAPAILALPTLAPLNVHASLLPRHRGAAPIAAALSAGDSETGITIMRMSVEMDAGDILLQRRLAIGPSDTTATLTARLAELGGATLAAAIAALRGPGLRPTPQDAAGVTYAPRLTRADGRIDWKEPAATIERKVRAFTPWPAAFTRFEGRLVKVLAARVPADEPAVSAPPGTVLAITDGVRVATGSGPLDLLELQQEGRRALGAPAFAAGARIRAGTRFDG